MAKFRKYALENIIRLIDLMGYVLMMLLSVMLWWGIYSGVEITGTQLIKNNLAAVDHQEIAVPVTSSEIIQHAAPWHQSRENRKNFWSLATGY